MTPDPAALRLLTAWADQLAIPRVLPVAVCAGESGFDPNAVGDNGMAWGLLQTRVDVWGYPGGQWLGIDGLSRSIQALTPQWQVAIRPLMYEWERYDWQTKVQAFARFWQSAQRADMAAVVQNAERALRAGYEALALITSEPSTDHKVETMKADISIFQRRAVWAFDWNQQAEHDADAIAATLTRFSITALHQEAFYGMTWQGDIDRAKNGGAFGSPRSLVELSDLRARLATQGIALIPVFVPRGMAGEAEKHAEAAKVCGACIVDMECDASGDYWPSAQIHQIGIYARALREACGPDVLIGWQPDGRLADAARSSEWNQVVEAAAPYVNVWLPQLYAGWGAYGVGQRAIEADTARFHEFAALGPVCPTLYMAESLNEPAALWRELGPQSLGPVGFRFGAMDLNALTLFGSFEVAGPVVPPPVEPPTIDIYGIKYGLIEKIVQDQFAEAYADLGKLVKA